MNVNIAPELALVGLVAFMLFVLLVLWLHSLIEGWVNSEKHKLVLQWYDFAYTPTAEPKDVAQFMRDIEKEVRLGNISARAFVRFEKETRKSRDALSHVK